MSIAILHDHSCPCSAAVSWLLEEAIDWTRCRSFDISQSQPEDINKVPILMLVVPIHAMSSPEAPWAEAWPLLENLSLRDKRVALWALGSDFCFDEDRLQTLAALRQKLLDKGARLLGEVPPLQWKPMPTQLLASDRPVRLIHCRGQVICQQGLCVELLQQWLQRLRAETMVIPAPPQ